MKRVLWQYSSNPEHAAEAKGIILGALLSAEDRVTEAENEATRARASAEQAKAEYEAVLRAMDSLREAGLLVQEGQ